jgi:hypothetical protein
MAGGPAQGPHLAAKRDPLWWSSSAVVGDQFIAKFGWSRPAALGLVREIGVLTALGREPRVPFLPEVVAGPPTANDQGTELPAANALPADPRAADQDQRRQPGAH